MHPDPVWTKRVDPEPPERAGADDAFWMHHALLSAMAAEGRASPNPTVGAVIVKDGVLIATGATEPYGQRHAERCAIDNVADRTVLRGATIYTTLEPCAHWGKQPPCADLVASCGFERCVVGVQDPNPRVGGAGLERVRAAGAEVLSGVLRNEILTWHLPYLFPYLFSQAGGRPLISAFAVDRSDAADPNLGGPGRDRRRSCDDQ
jgi:diaminohydroxyphosphoribosylaminopyrimidine deaminase/5-amino-6-(5-phosphoribosylamino)uracil reductase